MHTYHKCYLCGERDRDENLEYEASKCPRFRYAHLSCKEEAAYLLDGFMKYEYPSLKGG